MSLEPLMFRYAVPALSPPAQMTPDGTEYDSSLDVVVKQDGDGKVPNVLLPDFAGRVTKKADIEKGEDQKDAPRPRPQPPPPPPPEPPQEDQR